MEIYKIRRYRNCGKWIELWLDGMEYPDDETIWNETTQEYVKTGDKSYNFSCKSGTLFYNIFRDSDKCISSNYNEDDLIGLECYLDDNGQDLRFFPPIQHFITYHSNKYFGNDKNFYCVIKRENGCLSIVEQEESDSSLEQSVSEAVKKYNAYVLEDN